MIIKILAKSLHNLLLPGVLRLFLLCILAYVLSWSILAWVLSAFISSYIGVTGLDGLIFHVIGGAGGMLIAWFLFPLLYPILISFFDDNIAMIIERKDYPELPAATPPFWPTIMHDVIFSLKAIGLNILCLPFYIFPPIGVFVYYLLNGYLLGTQFFRMAAGRRVNVATARAMESNARWSIIMTGVAISFCATIPFLNLAAPIIGVAAMLHLFHALRGTPAQEVLPPR